MPTAVMTESSEKTMSMTAMVTMVHAKLAGLPAAAPRRVVSRRVLGLRLFQLLVHLDDALADQEQPAGQQDEVAPRDFAGVEVVQERHRGSVKSGVVRPSRNDSENSSRMRVPSAAPSPILRASRLLLLRQLADDDREEDDVVDAEDDLHHREREQPEEDRGPRQIDLADHAISRISDFFNVTSPPPSRSTTNCSGTTWPRTTDLSISCTVVVRLALRVLLERDAANVLHRDGRTADLGLERDRRQLQLALD